MYFDYFYFIARCSIAWCFFFLSLFRFSHLILTTVDTPQSCPFTSECGGRTFFPNTSNLLASGYVVPPIMLLFIFLIFSVFPALRSFGCLFRGTLRTMPPVHFSTVRHTLRRKSWDRSDRFLLLFSLFIIEGASPFFRQLFHIDPDITSRPPMTSHTPSFFLFFFLAGYKRRLKISRLTDSTSHHLSRFSF